MRKRVWQQPLTAILFVLLISNLSHAVQPSIIFSSSTGGTTQNKANAQDIMYLIKQGDVLNFGAIVDQPVSFEWYVNKSNAKTTAGPSTSDSFTWTVPNQENTWEIHLRVWNGLSEETHKEWVVSTFDSNKAPKIFDHFTDGQYKNRDPANTDPWGRNLPEWTASGGTWGASLLDARSDEGTISVPCNITTGTWKMRYRYVNAPPTTDYTRGLYLYFITKSNGGKLLLFNPPDGHWWVDYWSAVGEIDGSSRRVPNACPYINMVGSQIGGGRVAGTSFHDVTFIRDNNGYSGTWLDGSFVEYSKDINMELTNNAQFAVYSYNTAGYTLVVDDIEIYDGVFLIPNRGISYGAGVITINDFDGALDRINAAVNDQSVFSYDSLTNTATCYVDILVKSGAELEITSGTLKMLGGKSIKYEREAMIFLENATVASTNSSPWYWAISGASSYASIVFSVINSSVSNCGGFSASSIKTFYIKNSRFTDLVGTYPFNVSFKRPPTGGLLISGSLFRGKTGAETIFLQGGDQFHQLIPKAYGMDIIDSAFENITLYRHYEYPYYLSPGRPGGTANLVNVKTSSLGYNGTTYRFKYYLDVLVTDSNDRPVKDATVTVTNEVDNVNNPAENMLTSWQYIMVGDQVSATGEDYFDGQQSNWFKGLKDVNDHSSSLTDITGHTPLPDNISETLVITDKVNVTTYTYTVTASKDGVSASITGLDIDESWYRPNPNAPTRTLTIKLPAIFDYQNPVVSIISPKNGEIIFGPTLIKLAPNDDYGINRVELFIDDNLTSTLTSNPYEWNWDITNVSEGEHRIKAKAYDEKGNNGETVITVKVVKTNKVAVFPNPYIKGKSPGDRIYFGNLPKESVLRIFTISGELIQTIKHELSTDGGNEEWNISNISSGIYVYTIISAKGTTRGKLSIIK